MKEIRRYVLPDPDAGLKFTLEMPAYPKVLAVQVSERYGDPSLWAMVDPSDPVEKVPFRIVGTGENIPDEEAKWLEHEGTFQHLGFVWHVFRDRG